METVFGDLLLLLLCLVERSRPEGLGELGNLELVASRAMSMARELLSLGRGT